VRRFAFDRCVSVIYPEAIEGSARRYVAATMRSVRSRCFKLAVCIATLLCGLEPRPATAQQLPEAAIPATPAPPEPRYAAPTDRDRIGRIWAPVLINGSGPFRLVLDTGATHSAVTAEVAAALGLPLTESNQVLLHGVTGSATVPTIAIERMVIGDLDLPTRTLPIVASALGGAEGILGTDGLLDKRITIDFRNDNITIVRSPRDRAGSGFIVVPFKLAGGLAIADAHIGHVSAKAIIDTGGQGTLGNQALREALLAHYGRVAVAPDGITGITQDVQIGNRAALPPLALGRLVIANVLITTGDMDIFKQWDMTRDPVLLIGMDVIGVFGTVVIDYARRELWVRASGGSIATE